MLRALKGPYGAWLAILAVAYVAILRVNLPGHLSVDSVISLAEGRTGRRITWGPPLYSWLLGLADRIHPGTALFVSASFALLLLSWALLPLLRQRLLWSGPILLAGAVLLPQLAIYQGIVWKDVLFANFTVAAFVALAFAFRQWDSLPRRWILLALAGALLAVASLTRQNGFVMIAAAAAAVALTGFLRGRWLAGLAMGAGLALFSFGAMGVIDASVPVKEAPGADLDRGIRVVEQYDIIGAAASDPAYPLPVLAERAPQTLALVRDKAPEVWSPVRSDTLNGAPELGLAMWSLPKDVVDGQWRQMILTDPLGYVNRRLAVFRWVFATPAIDLCLPVHTGIGGRPEDLQLAGLAARSSDNDRRLFNYMTWFLDTPAMSHVAYALIALAAGVYCLIRRAPADIAVAGMLGGALAWAATFFILSLACDYRYLYFLDLAAISAVLYLAVDPGLKRAA